MSEPVVVENIQIATEKRGLEKCNQMVDWALLKRLISTGMPTSSKCGEVNPLRRLNDSMKVRAS